MSLLKSRRAFVVIASVAVTGTLFATESFAAKPAVTYKNLTSADFNTSFSAMKALVPLAKKGTGKVAVILPDTVSGRIAATFPLPFLARGTRAFIAENDVVKSAEVRFLYVTGGFGALAAKLSVANSVPVRATDRMATKTRLLFSRDILFPPSLSISLL
jgi:hypothetical protein